MHEVVLIIHLILAVSLVAVVLVQRSEGGGLGIGGGQGGMGSFASARGTANFLTRLTTYLAIGFIITSLSLAIIAVQGKEKTSILDVAPMSKEVGEMPAPSEPEAPSAPQVPASQ